MADLKWNDGIGSEFTKELSMDSMDSMDGPYRATPTICLLLVKARTQMGLQLYININIKYFVKY